MSRTVALFTATLLLLALTGSVTVLAGGGCHVPAVSTEGSGQTVSMKACAFAPTILRASVGAPITWSNDDVVPHAIHGAGWHARGRTTTDGYTPLSPHANASHTFDAPGIYPYMCYVHPGMAGVVLVGDAAFGGTSASIPRAGVGAAGTAGGVDAWLALALGLASAVAGYAIALARRPGDRARAMAPRAAHP